MQRRNVTLAIGHLALLLFQLLVLPLLLPSSAWWALVIVLGVLSNNALWSLIHEAIHGNLHADPGRNALWGRLLTIGFGSSFSQVRVAHLLHHKHNRVLDTVEIFDPRRTTWGKAALGYYPGLFVGLFLSQLLTPIFFCLPLRVLLRLAPTQGYTGEVAQSLLRRPEALRAIRIDGLVHALLVTLSAYLYGTRWPLLVAIYLARALCISFLDYVYHYATPVGDVLHGKNLRLAAPISRWLLHFNYHGVHHRQPSMPWHELPRRFAEERLGFDGDYARDALAQLRGPRAQPPPP